MFNTLLFIHLVVSVLMIIVVLLQKTSADGLRGIGGGGNNMGLVSSRAAANFLTKTTIFLAILFFINALVLGNISSNNRSDISKTLETHSQDISSDSQSAITEDNDNTELDQMPEDEKIDIRLPG